jgi:acyl-CoA reductase-like NAD-dependent aldehyde dehydrogenase
MILKTDFLINGAYHHLTTATFAALRPADGSELCRLPSASVDDVNAAVLAAQNAYAGHWRLTDGEVRQRLLLRWAEVLDERAEAIAALVAENTGTPAPGNPGGVRKIASMARYYAGLAVRNYGKVLSLGDDHVNFVVQDPVGVVAVMPPWNSPLEATMQKLGPALAAGNTVVLRAPEGGPVGALLVAQAAHDAGFPAGVINAIVGHDPASGSALVEHPAVRVVTFTGSAATGKTIARSCAAQMKRCVMELGGKSPFIVFTDADLERAVADAVTWAFAFQGQVCCANTRILIERPIREAFTAKLLAKVRALRMGLPGSPHPLGPLFNRKVFDTVTRYVELGRRDGRLLHGGAPLATEHGHYYPPTVFEFDDSRSPVCQEEIFGPVLALVPFDAEADALRIANETAYGLAATVYSGDRGRVLRLVRRLDAGTVWANCCFRFNIHMPWGGPKDSGQGREYGEYAMRPFYEEKNVWLGA